MDLLPIQSDMMQFIEQGVSGFILKNATTKDFINTIRMVAKGKNIFPDQLHGTLLSEIVDSAVNELMDSKLIESTRMSEAEKNIIGAMSRGLTHEEIAKQINITVYEVKGHIHNILEKMSLSTRIQIAVYKNSGEKM
jgi:DNA-binding NarL/FixJ family response regulator